MSPLSCDLLSSNVRPASEKVRSEDVLDAGTPRSPIARTDSFGQEEFWLSQYSNKLISGSAVPVFRYASTWNTRVIGVYNNYGAAGRSTF